jgi:serine/threonine protein kinase
MNKIGKYQLNKIIGKGGSCTVYHATDTFSEIEVALKVMDMSEANSPNFDQSNFMQFMTEATLAGQLTHPHIAAILEAAVTDDYGYIAIEYVPGGDLSNYTKLGSLVSQEDAIQIAFKSCGALDYAFRQGIVHRDIKPQNILIASGTNIKVADFGAAYLSKAKDAQIESIGSPLFMSPEQLRNMPLGLHSDMYSLGVVLYLLFTGHRPYLSANLADLSKDILNAEPLAPSSHRPELSKDVDRIILRMMAKLPEMRYPSWAELALDIAKIGRLSIYETEISDIEKFGALKKVRLLNQLDDAEIWELVQSCKWSRVPSRTVIVREGDIGSSLFFLGSGQVKVTKQERLLNLLEAGECIGEMSYIKEGEIPRQATVESIRDTVLAEFDKASLDKLSMKCRYQLAQALLHALVDRLILADERLIKSG